MLSHCPALVSFSVLHCYSLLLLYFGQINDDDDDNVDDDKACTKLNQIRWPLCH